MTGSSTGRVRIKPDLSQDGNIVSCTPSNTLGNGPRVELKLDVKGNPYRELQNYTTRYGNILFGLWTRIFEVIAKSVDIIVACMLCF